MGKAKNEKRWAFPCAFARLYTRQFYAPLLCNKSQSKPKEIIWMHYAISFDCSVWDYVQEIQKSFSLFLIQKSNPKDCEFENILLGNSSYIFFLSNLADINVAYIYLIHDAYIWYRRRNLIACTNNSLRATFALLFLLLLAEFKSSCFLKFDYTGTIN